MAIWVSVLSNARREADLTQKDIAQALGCTAAIVANIETLRTPISGADIIIWGARCNMDEPELFERFLIELRLRKARKR
jgi:transcriptional regulator with XRE-family HTH domain